MQVLDELRQGVTKLRKVERHTKMSVEYELTPYEILMEDIRQKKYTLKKVSSILCGVFAHATQLCVSCFPSKTLFNILLF